MPSPLVASLLLTALSVAGCSVSRPEPQETQGLVAAPPAPAAAGMTTVTGTVTVADADGPTIVTLQPSAGGPLPATARPVLDQSAMTFFPDVLVVRTGEATEFRNSDAALHNIRVLESATKQGTFNVALPSGGRYEFTFERDGVYQVDCNIHPVMSALIIATSYHHAAVADAQGGFTIEHVPSGDYDATATTGTRTITRPIHVAGETTRLDLTQEP